MSYRYEVKIKGTRTSIFNKMEKAFSKMRTTLKDLGVSPYTDSERGHGFTVHWQAQRCCVFSIGSNYISSF